MKTRTKRLILVGTAVVALGFAGMGRLANPTGPKLAPELAAHAVPKNLMPRNVTGGPPPPGTFWEVYSVPMAYSQVVEAMRREPGWRMTEGIDSLRLPKASFEATERGAMRQIDVRPGRLLWVEDMAQPGGIGRSGGYSVVTIAVPGGSTLGRSMMAFVGRIMGHPAGPVASKKSVVFIRDNKYVVAAPVATSRTKPPKAAP